jgi:hypothetical protein
MNAHDLQKIVEAYSLTCLSYEKAFNKQLLDLFISDLSGYSAQQIAGALQAHRTDPDRGRFFPKVADVVYQITLQNKKPETTPELEWFKVLKAAANGRKPITSNQTTLAALQMVGGCNAVGYAEQSNIERLKRSFMDAYKAIEQASANDLPQELENISALIAQKTGVQIRD